MKSRVAVAVSAAILVLSACGKNPGGSSPSPAGPAPAATNESSPTPAAMPAPAAAPSHNYQMADNGTYGYEPALSEDDIRNGTASKPLIMMRYEGNRNGTYVLLILGTDTNDSSSATRVSCQAPCQFAKLETLSGDTVVNTETLRVTPDSLFGAMLQDAANGQLVAYGQDAGGDRPIAPVSATRSTQEAAAQDPASSAADPGPTDMWLGQLDMNLRSCPGTACSALIVIPRHSKVSVETGAIQYVTETSGAQTPWARVTYAGPYCDAATLDPSVGCVNPRDSGGPVSGWVNFRLLSTTPTNG